MSARLVVMGGAFAAAAGIVTGLWLSSDGYSKTAFPADRKPHAAVVADHAAAPSAVVSDASPPSPASDPVDTDAADSSAAASSADAAAGADNPDTLPDDAESDAPPPVRANPRPAPKIPHDLDGLY